MDTLSAGVEKCIEIESSKGIKGYSKCFKMYEYLLNYEINNMKLIGLWFCWYIAKKIEHH